MGGFLYKICESGKHIEEYSLQEMIECVRFGNAVASLCVGERRSNTCDACNGRSN